MTLACHGSVITLTHIASYQKLSCTHSYCLRCKLKSGKQCTPDSIDGVCCDANGMFASKSVTCSQTRSMEGFCKAGVCVTYICYSSGGPSMCRGSKLHSCLAKCEGLHTTNVCYDQTELPWSNDRLTMPNGAICSMSQSQAECLSGPCSYPQPPQP